MIDRRSALTILGGTPLVLVCRSSLAEARPARFLSARVDAAEQAFATGFDTAGSILFDVPTEARGHGGAVHPHRGEAVMMARRPGTFALAIDVASGGVTARFSAPDGNWFNGHAIFTADGLLHATETIIDSGDGRIGVYDPDKGYRRIGEIDAHGLEPHDIGLLSDGHTLAVANGGVLRHPDEPDMILNLADMRPSLAYVDSRNGDLLDRVEPPASLHQAGTRHLAIAPDDTVVIAAQFEGPSMERVPLFGLHRRGEPAIRLLQPPDRVLGAMRRYCGAAAVAAGGRVIAVSCPRGNLAVFWDIPGNRFLGTVEVPDSCGLAASADPDGFLVASGLGGIVEWSPTAPQGTALPGTLIAESHWDNHLTPLDI